MGFVVSVLLLACLGPGQAGPGRELGGLKLGTQNRAPVQAAEASPQQPGQSQPEEKVPLTNKDVISMVKGGLAESTIVLAIQHNAAQFDTSPQALIALRNQGVPEKVLNAMLSAGSGRPSVATAAQTPANTTAAQTPAKAVDLHSIRKVYLNPEWSDDDYMTAKKIRTIEKHTCLKMVGTMGAADASLTWVPDAFTGADMELLGKDGQVIWSRGSGLTPPLKALKEAVGCPK